MKYKGQHMMLFVLWSSFCFSVQAIESELTFYGGADAQMRYISAERDYGNNLFRKKAPQGNVFLGFKFNSYVGLELGYSRVTKRDKRTVTAYPEVILGVTNYFEPGDVLISNNSVKTEGLNTSVMGYLPLNDSNQLLGCLGVTRARVKLSWVRLANEISTFNDTEIAANRRDFVKTKYIAHAKAGIQHMLTDNVGLRALVGWENTKRFKMLAPKSPSNSALRASLKDSFTAGLGLTWYLK